MTKRCPQRKQAVFCRFEDIAEHLGAILIGRHDISCVNALVLDNANSLEMPGINHEGRVSGINELVDSSYLLFKEAQQVFLGPGVQRQTGLVQEQN